MTPVSFSERYFLENFNKIFTTIFFGKSCNDYPNECAKISTFQQTVKKIFETEISAHVGCALGTPNFLDLVGMNPTTSSLNRIFVTFFLEKKSGRGESCRFKTLLSFSPDFTLKKFKASKSQNLPFSSEMGIFQL